MVETHLVTGGGSELLAALGRASANVLRGLPRLVWEGKPRYKKTVPWRI